MLARIVGGWSLLALGALAGSLVQGAEPQNANPAGPLSPQDSLAAFQIHPDVRIELAASEPQVIDPVAVRFDEDGRMWVVEMRDYPHGPAAGEKPKSRIKRLEDRDGDGFFETATIFADELLFATELQPWRGGVIATLAGQVAWLPDENRDGQADKIETWYTGFAQENSQLRANHPRLGLDNQIYVANGLRGGAVTDARRPALPPLSISGMDFRFSPLTREFAAVSGVGQFGLSFDFFGNRFVCSNRNPLQHVVLDGRYLGKNPAAAISDVSGDVAKSGAASRVYPISRAWTTSNLHAGQFTAACGILIYCGRQLPAAFRGNGFTCDPTGNLVHREILQPSGATFSSQPDREGVEFLASPDEWFRPVNLELGPHDELYVADMYRAVIEHPEFVPDELKKRPDLLLGVDRGRIWRIVAKPAENTAATRPVTPRMSEMKTADLVALLDFPPAAISGEWRRETAARLIFERQDASCAEALQKMATVGGDAIARVRALWLLHGLGKMTRDIAAAAICDSQPRVQEQAVILAEPWLANDPALRASVRELARHEDARLRFQVALSLAPAQAEEDVEAIAAIALAGEADPWTRRAVAIAAGPHSAALSSLLIRRLNERNKPLDDNAAALIAAMIPPVAAAEVAEQRKLLAALVDLSEAKPTRRIQFLALKSLADANARRRRAFSELIDDTLRPAVDRVFANSLAAAADHSLPASERAEAVDLLAFSKNGLDRLAELAAGETDQALRLRAIAALLPAGEDDIWKTLAAGFRGESPEVRGAILDGLLARGSRTALLLDQIEAGQIKPAEIDAARLGRLLRIGDAPLRSRAEKALADAIPADRQKVLADYQVVLTLAGEPRRGQEIFKKHCAQCHRVGEIGVNVAPDISDSRVKQPTQILTDVIQPNRSIDGNYISYSAQTTDGRVLTGVLSAETPTSVTLRQPEDKSVTLLRSELESLKSNGISLMPEGLEKAIPHQDMADLIAFIKNWRYLDGRTPLGKGP